MTELLSTVPASPLVAFVRAAQGGDRGAFAPDAAGHERMRAAVDRLPEIYREVVLLFYFERKSYDEMGRLLGIGKAAVNARLMKARRTLRERLGDR